MYEQPVFTKSFKQDAKECSREKMSRATARSTDNQQKQGMTFSGQVISPREFHTALQSSWVLTTVEHAAATGIKKDTCILTFHVNTKKDIKWLMKRDVFLKQMFNKFAAYTLILRTKVP